MGVQSATKTGASRNRIGACTRGLASSADSAVRVVQGRNRFIPPLDGAASQSAQRACGRGWKSRAKV